MSLHETLRDSTLGSNALGDSALRDTALPPQTASETSLVHSVVKKPLRHRSAAVSAEVK